MVEDVEEDAGLGRIERALHVGLDAAEAKVEEALEVGVVDEAGPATAQRALATSMGPGFVDDADLERLFYFCLLYTSDAADEATIV